MICPKCGSLESKNFTKGSFWVELILWLCFLLPGLIYSVWRLSSRHIGCKGCGSQMISTKSPRGKELLKRYHSQS